MKWVVVTGQQIVRLPDGRLQLITMPNQPSSSATTATPTTRPQQQQQTLVRPTITLRPQQPALVVTSPTPQATPTLIQAPQTRLIMPAGMAAGGVAGVAGSNTITIPARPATSILGVAGAAASPTKPLIIRTAGRMPGTSVLSVTGAAPVLSATGGIPVLSASAAAPILSGNGGTQLLSTTGSTPLLGTTGGTSLPSASAATSGATPLLSVAAGTPGSVTQQLVSMASGQQSVSSPLILGQSVVTTQVVNASPVISSLPVVSLQSPATSVSGAAATPAMVALQTTQSPSLLTSQSSMAPNTAPAVLTLQSTPSTSLLTSQSLLSSPISTAVVMTSISSAPSILSMTGGTLTLGGQKVLLQNSASTSSVGTTVVMATPTGVRTLSGATPQLQLKTVPASSPVSEVKTPLSPLRQVIAPIQVCVLHMISCCGRGIGGVWGMTDFLHCI